MTTDRATRIVQTPTRPPIHTQTHILANVIAWIRLIERYGGINYGIEDSNER